MRKVAEGVYYSDRVTSEDIKTLKGEALKLHKLRSRICLHAKEDDPTQEMIIAMARGSIVPVHRHDDYETLMIVEGQADVIVYREDMSVQEVFRLGDEMHSCVVSKLYHQVVPISRVCVLHEVKHGPFKPMELR